MPFIWGVLVNLFGAFLALVGRKGLVSTATITAFVVVTAAMIVCMKAFIVAVLTAITVPSWMVNLIGFFVPSNTVGCLASIFSARSCKFAYRLAMEKIKALNEAS